jgi:nicotinamidase-related amidase
VLRLKARYYRWFPAEEHLGYAEETLVLHPAETAFVLVDVYLPGLGEGNDKAPQGNDRPLSQKDYRLWRDITVEHIGPALAAARVAGLPVIYVTNSGPRIALGLSAFAHKLRQSLGFEVEEAFSEERVDPREYHHGPPKQLQFPDAVTPQPGDFYVRKHVYSGFFATRLESLLRNLGVRNLICVGFRLDACLMSTMLDALYRNFKVILLRDCTLASELPHEIDEMAFTRRMLLWFEALVGVTVESMDFIAACRAHHGEGSEEGGDEGIT